MTPLYYEFKRQLITSLAAVFPKRTALSARVADNGPELDSDPVFYLYLEDSTQEGPAFAEDHWQGRYLLVEPSTEPAQPYRLCLMESVENVGTDRGPSFIVNIVNDEVVELVVNFLVNGTYPRQAITLQ